MRTRFDKYPNALVILPGEMINLTLSVPCENKSWVLHFHGHRSYLWRLFIYTTSDTTFECFLKPFTMALTGTYSF